MLSLNQRLAQQQKLSPQQIQYQKLLQLNTLSLEQRIKTELELNPILEETDILDESESLDDNSEEVDEVSSDDEFELEDFMNDLDIDNDRLNRSPGEEKVYPVTPATESLRENLMEQLHMLYLDEESTILGENIIQSLDKDGYFKEELSKLVHNMEMFEGVEVTEVEAENVLRTIQQLDPPGIAARSLKECMLLQLEYGSYDPYYSYLAKGLLIEHFDDFVNKRYDKIQTEMNMTRDTLKSTIDLIQRLNPRPGEGNIDSEQANQVTPDFLIEKVDDNFIISLNDKQMSSVTISQTYLDMLNQNKRKRKISKTEKETHKFLREKFESAKWFIASIQQRRETLLKIMQAILEKQWQFFEHGARHLKPMIYKDIAEEIMMDISTISRVVNGKYVQSPQGIHELKYFFSEGLSTDEGAEISNKHIKELIKEIIDNESKKSPLSDDKIAKMLKDKGIHIARRTVAKYREQMGLSVARLRKEL